MKFLDFITKRNTKPQEVKSTDYFDGYTVVVNNNGVFIPTVNAVNVMMIISQYTTIAPLNTAVDMIANAVGSLPIILVRKKDSVEIDSHPVLDLLNHPNNEEQKTRHDLLRDITIWKIIEGDAYVSLLSGKSFKQLSVLKPQFITIQQDSSGYPNIFRYNSGNSSVAYTKNISTSRFITPDKTGDLLQIRNFNPNSTNGTLKGLTEIVSIYFELEQYLESSQHNLKLLKNGARPSGALSIPSTPGSEQTMSDTQYQRLKDSIDESYTGSYNAGRPLLLDGGLQWQEMSLSPKDMDFATMKAESEKQIYKNLGVPIEMIMATGNTYSNMETAKLNFYEGRVIPTAESILNELNSWLLPLFPDLDGCELRVDEKNVDALMLKRDAINKTINDDPTMTINEKRALKGLEPVAGGNKIVTATGIAIAGDDYTAPVTASMVDVTPDGAIDDSQKKTLNLKTINLISLTQV